jgi:hypothetical protein
MTIFQILRRREATPPPPLPVVHAPNPDILWSEIATAIGSAGVHLRGDDSPAIIDFPGYGGGCKYEREEVQWFLKAHFSGINDEQMARALRYLNNRVISHKRHKDADSIMRQLSDFPRSNWMRDTQNYHRNNGMNN